MLSYRSSSCGSHVRSSENNKLVFACLNSFSCLILLRRGKCSKANSTPIIFFSQYTPVIKKTGASTVLCSAVKHTRSGYSTKEVWRLSSVSSCFFGALSGGGGGRGGALLGILDGGVPPSSPNPDPISDQKCSFSRPFSLLRVYSAYFSFFVTHL